jgi:hypothetical protein
MAQQDAQKLAKVLADQAEAKRIRDYINKYQVHPDNYIAKLGQRSAQQFVLKDPTANNVRTYQEPNLSVFGMTFSPKIDDPNVRAKYLKARAAGETDQLRDLTFDQSGYDLSDKNTPLAGKILLGPEATSRNNNVLEHEYMHRGITEFNKGVDRYNRVNTGERYPYMYPAVYPDSLKRNPELPGTETYTSRYGKKPSKTQIADLNEVLARAKEEYERRYTSGPSGGMPYVYQPNLGDKLPPSIIDRIKAKAKSGAQKLSEILSSVRLEKNP